MKKTIYLHLGMSKTGTTAVQKMLSKHALKLKNELLCSAASRFVISSELLEHLNDEMWQRMLAFFEPFELKVIIYLRRQDEAIISVFNELTKKHATTVLFEDFCQAPVLLKQFDYRTLLTRIERYVGRNNMMVAVYNRESLKNKSICHDFLHRIDTHLTKPEQESERHINRSLTPATAHLMARINLNTQFTIDHATHYGLACQFSSLLNQELTKRCNTDYAYFRDSKTKQVFMSQYEESNRDIAQRYIASFEMNSGGPVSSEQALSEKDEARLLNAGLDLMLNLFIEKYGNIDGIAKMIGVLWNSELEARVGANN